MFHFYLMEIDEPRFRQLMDSLVQLLVFYEKELTAWYVAFREAEKRQVSGHQPLHIRKGIESVLRSPALHFEAEAEYVEFEPLLRAIDSSELSAALDRATASIDRIRTRRRE